MEKLEYGYKLTKLVNNLDSWKIVSHDIYSLSHIINNNRYEINAKKFYNKQQNLMIKLCEENIETIADEKNYINWIKQYGEPRI